LVLSSGTYALGASHPEFGTFPFLKGIGEFLENWWPPQFHMEERIYQPHLREGSGLKITQKRAFEKLPFQTVPKNRKSRGGQGPKNSLQNHPPRGKGLFKNSKKPPPKKVSRGRETKGVF